MKTITHRSVRFRAKFNVKTDEPPRAGWTELAGRIWPAGRTLPTPVLKECTDFCTMQNSSVHICVLLATVTQLQSVKVQ